MDEKKTPRCEICRELLRISKVPNQEVAFIRGDRIVERYKVCPTCYNKYVLQVRQDIMPPDLIPEKHYPLHVNASGYFMREKKFSAKKVKFRQDFVYI